MTVFQSQSENARRLLVRILQHPEEFNMEDWYRANLCGTTACMAGHAALLMGWKPVKPVGEYEYSTIMFQNSDGQRETAERLGEEFLDITWRVSCPLFISSDLEALQILDRAAGGELITRDLIQEVHDEGVKMPLWDFIEDLQEKYLTPEELAETRRRSKELGA